MPSDQPAQTSARAARGEAVASAVPLAAGFLREAASQPPGLGLFSAYGRDGTPVRVCGGHVCVKRAGFVPECAPKAALAVCPDRGRGNPDGGP